MHCSCFRRRYSDVSPLSLNCIFFLHFLEIVAWNLFYMPHISSGVPQNFGWLLLHAYGFVFYGCQTHAREPYPTCQVKKYVESEIREKRGTFITYMSRCMTSAESDCEINCWLLEIRNLTFEWHGLCPHIQSRPGKIIDCAVGFNKKVIWCDLMGTFTFAKKMD